MIYTDEEIYRWVDAIDLDEYLMEKELLHDAVRCLLENEIIEYPEWLDEPSEDTS